MNQQERSKKLYLSIITLLKTANLSNESDLATLIILCVQAGVQVYEKKQNFIEICEEAWDEHHKLIKEITK